MKSGNILAALNVAERCRSYRIGLWQCPHFLFIIIGLIISLSIITTHLISSVYTEPEVSVAIVFIVTVLLFIIGHSVINAFEKVAVSSQIKSEFISILSHELRNPLSAIKWQLNIMADAKTAPAPPEYQKGFATIGEENERMIRLINDLLDVNRIEDHALGLTPTVFSLDALTTEVVKKFEPYAEASNLSLMMISPKTEFRVRADEGRIKSVVTRLIDNAIRYSAARGEIVVTIEDSSDGVRWSVTDQGTGIPKEEVERIFSKFFRASNVLRYQTEGLGVGLYIAKYVIEALGGKIGFHTLEGRGSTFFFTLPKAK
jgi:signal transduction histidine kinase